MPLRHIESRLVVTLMMRPQRCSIMGFTAARVIRNGAIVLTSIMRRKSAGAMSRKSLPGTAPGRTVFGPRPALLTSTSSRPKRAGTAPQALEHVRVDVAGKDAQPRLDEAQSHGPANAAPRTGNDRNPAARLCR